MKKAVVILLLSAVLLLSACGESSAPAVAPADAAETPSAASAIQDVLNTEIFSDHPYQAEVGHINLNEVENNIVYINEPGEYEITGSLDGFVQVEANVESDEIKLILNGATIRSKNFACIYVASARKVTVSLADGSFNALMSEGNFSQIDANTVDACIFSKDDLDVQGHGSLSISCGSGHGIAAKDDFDLKNATVDITCAKKGISVNDAFVMKSGELSINAGTEGVEAFSVEIQDGVLTIVSGDDGINATAGGQSQPGSGLQDASHVPYVSISGGKITIDSVGDGIDSNGFIVMSGGSLTIACPDNPDDECLDYESTFTQTGGELYIEDNSDVEQMMVGFGGPIEANPGMKDHFGGKPGPMNPGNAPEMPPEGGPGGPQPPTKPEEM